mgnify:FL=1
MSQNSYGQRAFYKFGDVGSADIFIVKDGLFYAAECKRPGNKQSDAQIAWQKQLESAGGKYILCYSVEDIQKIL